MFQLYKKFQKIKMFVQLFYIVKPVYNKLVGYYEFLKVNKELEKHSANISGVPHYVVGDWIIRFTLGFCLSVWIKGYLFILSQINGKHQLSGGQPAEVFLRAFQVAANWVISSSNCYI